MGLSWFSAGAEDVAGLVAKRSFARAAKVLRAQLERDPRNVSLELQLADVLQLDGQGGEAVAILLRVADAYTRSGFLAKAIALLKKVQRIDPERAAAVDRKIAALAKERDDETARRTALREAMQVRPRPQDASVRPATPEPPPEPPPEPAPEPAAPPEEPAEEAPPPVAAHRRPVFDLPTPSFEPPVALSARPQPSAAPEPEATPRGPALEPGPAPAAPMPLPDAEAGTLEFELELGAEGLASGAPAEARLEKTPLFSDFSADELLEVIRGLRLLTFGPGEIVVAEGEPGDSLFVLTTGTVLAFCKDPQGRYRKVREMSEGSFFGEVSILTGLPRTATVTAATPIELLELDSATLASIAERHPHVHDVLRKFCEARAGSIEEIRVRMGRPGPPPAGTA